MRKSRLFMVLIALFGLITVQAQIRYVTEGGNGTKDGSSWENASKDLQKMIDLLSEEGGGEVWVKGGVYVPTKKIADVDEAGNPTTNRDKTFRLRKNVSLYGGFKGMETVRDQRNPEENITVLSGTLNANESAYHVVVGVGEDDMGGAEIDGFTITGGKALYTEADPNAEQENAEHPFKRTIYILGKEKGIDKEFRLPRGNGAGLYLFGCSNVTMNDLKITENSGNQEVGVRVRACFEVELSNSIIYNNLAFTGGDAGGYCNGSAVNNTTLIISNLIVQGNKNMNGNSANNSAFTINYSSLTLQNMTIENNTASGGVSGGLFIGYSTINIKDLYVKNNISPSGKAVNFEKIKNSYLTNIHLSENKTTDGTGGATGVQFNYLENVSINGLFVKGHKRDLDEGGVTLVNSNLVTIEDFRIENNEAGRKYGGLYILNGKDILLKNGVIKENHSEDVGGGIALANSSVTGQNLLIANNSSTTGNSAIHLDAKSTLDLINSTVVNNSTLSNTAVGGLDFSKNITLSNSIVWGNKNGIGISNVNEVIPSTSTHNLIEGIDLSLTGQDLNGLDGLNTVTDADGIFANFIHSDYRLLPVGTNPVLAKGNDGSDLGYFQTEEIYDPFNDIRFEGGTLAKDGVTRMFRYTGAPIDLQLLYPAGAGDVDYIGNLPVNAGTYTVTASLTGGTYNGPDFTVNVIIEKAYMPFTLDEIPAMNITGGAYSLSCDYDYATYPSASPSFIYMSSNPFVATLSGDQLIFYNAGYSIITAKMEDSNYETNEAVRVAWVLSDDASIEGIYVDGNKIEPSGNGDYVIIVDPGRSIEDLINHMEVITGNDGATVDVIDNENGTISIIVLAEDGTQNETIIGVEERVISGGDPDPVLTYYPVTIETIGDGDVVVSGLNTAGQAAATTTLSVTATAKEGFEFYSIVVSSGRITSELSLENGGSFTVYGETTITVMFMREGFDPNPDPGVGNTVVENDTKLWVADGTLYVRTAQPQALQVVSLTGAVVAQQQVAGEESISLTKGIYLVCVGKKTEKIIVR